MRDINEKSKRRLIIKICFIKLKIHTILIKLVNSEIKNIECMFNYSNFKYDKCITII